MIVSVYKILRFFANLQKFQTLVPAKNRHLKVYCNAQAESAEGPLEIPPPMGVCLILHDNIFSGILLPTEVAGC